MIPLPLDLIWAIIMYSPSVAIFSWFVSGAGKLVDRLEAADCAERVRAVGLNCWRLTHARMLFFIASVNIYHYWNGYWHFL